MGTFQMNGYSWQVLIVGANDPMLVDRTGTLTIGTTDPSTCTIYLSADLHGPMLIRVLLHELGHCALCSFHLLDDIHRMCYPEYWMEAEEWVCNFIADYGFRIFAAAYKTLGMKALDKIPEALDQFLRRDGYDILRSITQ